MNAMGTGDRGAVACVSLLIVISLTAGLRGQPPADPPLPDGAFARLGSPLWRNVADTRSFLAFTPDGLHVVVGHDGAMRAIEFETGREKWQVAKLGFDLVGAVVPGNRILLCSSDKLRVIDARDGKEERRLQIDFQLGSNPVADGSYIALHDNFLESRGAAVVFDLNTGRRLWQYGGDGVTGICFPVGFVPGQPQLVARVYRGGDTFAAVLDVRAKKLVREWKLPGSGQPGVPASAVLSPDGRLLWSGADKAVRLWDVASGKEGLSWEGHTAEVVAVAFSGDGRRLVSVAKDRTLRWWDAATGKELGRIKTESLPYRIAVSPNGQRAAVASSGENTLRRFDLKAGRELPVAEGHTNRIEQIAFLPDGRSLLTAGLDGTVRVWDIASRREVRRWKPNHRTLNCLAVCGDGKLAVTAGYNDGVVRVWNIATGIEMRSMSFPPRVSVGCLAVMPGGTTVAAGALHDPDGNAIRIWDMATGAEVGKLAGQFGSAGALSFHLDGRRIASTASDAAFSMASERTSLSAHVWDRTTGRPVVLEGATDFAAIFSPDGCSLAVVRQHQTGKMELVLVETASGQVRQTFDHRPGPSRTLAFSLDGRMLATPGPYPERQSQRLPGAWLWDVDTAQTLHRFDAGRIWSLALSADGNTLATGGEDGTVLLWDFSKARPAAPATEVADRLWNDLAGDAPQAFRAVVALSNAGERGVALLKAKLKPAAPIEPKKLAGLFADLEDERFAVRQKAAAELAALGPSEEALRERLKLTNSAEARKSIAQMVEKPDGWLTQPQRLREGRAVEALQRNGTPAARRLLEELAAGHPAARLTREASDVLRRK